jgi:aminopeptidase YwaD
MRAHLLYLSIWLCCCSNLHAQNLSYARQVVNMLCSDEMAGRGYVKDGSKKAADFIATEFQKAGLLSFGSSYFQSYGFPVVVFPNEPVFKVGDDELVPGIDFIASPGCRALSGVFETIFIDSVTIDNNTLFSQFEKSAFYKSLICISPIRDNKVKHPERLEKVLTNQYKSRGLVFIDQKKLTWGVATEWDEFPKFYVTEDKIKRYHQRLKIDISPDLRQHQTQNIIGYMKGKVSPDSFVVVSAHYDHLGMFGKNAVFRGANDNASGVAMMLDLMQYYAKNQPAYSVVFMAFAGEEAGLFGSYYYTQNPLFPLRQISLMINLDLMGTGDAGMTVVNGDVFVDAYNELALINLTENYLPEIKSRGKAANSDHYYFSENGVRAFFFYLMGKYNYYHDVFDSPEALTYARYEGAYRLVVHYVNEMMR